MQPFALASSTRRTAPGSNFVVVAGTDGNPLNVYGWPGFWPVFAEFRRSIRRSTPLGGRDARLHASPAATRRRRRARRSSATTSAATTRSTYQPRAAGREAARARRARLRACGSRGCGSINYWQTLHDLAGNPITAGRRRRSAASRHARQQRRRAVCRSRRSDGQDAHRRRRRRLSSATSPLEGFQGLTMLDEMDNKSALLLTRLSPATARARRLRLDEGGDRLRLHVAAALVAVAVAVTEMAHRRRRRARRGSIFPQPTAFAITDRAEPAARADRAGRRLRRRSSRSPTSTIRDVGGTAGSRATFDGDPFPADNQLARRRGARRTIARSPVSRSRSSTSIGCTSTPRTQALVDDSDRVAAAPCSAARTVTARRRGYAIVGMRTALRSISLDAHALLERHARHARRADRARRRAARRRARAAAPRARWQLIRAEADFLADKLSRRRRRGRQRLRSRRRRAPTRSPTRSSRRRASSAASSTRISPPATRSIARRRCACTADLDARFWMTDVRAFRTDAGRERHARRGRRWRSARSKARCASTGSWSARRPGNERIAAELLERVQAHEQARAQRLGRRQRRRRRAVSRGVHRRRPADGRARAHRRAGAHRRRGRSRSRLRPGDLDWPSCRRRWRPSRLAATDVERGSAEGGLPLRFPLHRQSE